MKEILIIVAIAIVAFLFDLAIITAFTMILAKLGFLEFSKLWVLFFYFAFILLKKIFNRGNIED